MYDARNRSEKKMNHITITTKNTYLWHGVLLEVFVRCCRMRFLRPRPNLWLVSLWPQYRYYFLPINLQVPHMPVCVVCWVCVMRSSVRACVICMERVSARVCWNMYERRKQKIISKWLWHTYEDTYSISIRAPKCIVYINTHTAVSWCYFLSFFTLKNWTKKKKNIKPTTTIIVMGMLLISMCEQKPLSFPLRSNMFGVRSYYSIQHKIFQPVTCGKLLSKNGHQCSVLIYMYVFREHTI